MTKALGLEMSHCELASVNMPCISLWNPWAQAIFAIDPATGKPVKRDETRKWPTRVRGRVAIHAAKTMVGKTDIGEETLNAFGMSWERMPSGVILGTVEIVACVSTNYALDRTPSELLWGNYDAGRYAWELKDARLLPIPVPYRGQQGFWTVNVDEYPAA